MSVSSSLRIDTSHALQTLKHPNIVRLYDVIETDKYIGIILEYASGGELFDHILAHRYLREKDACKLFSQLISGVWYIHQKKIVHRDLKLENLLLDRNRNVIITDFGFANRFEHRSDDLMQTSCGSPCYAAPELVISDGLYVGSAVDIWSCGVILYAMLAGYLPFDDDPANPDGDNINLLYKYIVNTPLSFPDYISPEARDLLSIMLVPDPARRADLPTIMGHKWLAPYAHSFSRNVDELERTAMEQHHQKRLAYQRSMKQTAAAEPGANKMSRSHSAAINGTSHSRSQRAQPEYLYETSGDTSMYSTSPTSTRRGFNSAIVLPTSPALSVDDDPFAPTSGIHAPSASSPAYANGQNGIEEEGRSRKDAPPSSMAPVKSSPDSKRKGGFRHTIQVEYGEDAEQSQPQRPLTAEPPSATSPRRSSSVRASERVAVATPSIERKPPPQVTESVGKPLPITPSSSVGKENAIPRITERSKGELAEPVLSIEVTSPPITPHVVPEEKTSSQTGTQSSSGSASSRGRHKRGISVDKIGITKIFSSNTSDSQHQTNGSGSRASSQKSSPARTGSRDTITGKDVHRRPSTLQVPPSPAQNGANDSALLSPDTASSTKKSRRNTLTVMVEPFRASLKQRSKARNATPESATEKTPTEKERRLEATPVSTQPPALPKKDHVSPSTPQHFSPRVDAGANPASTLKANKVMQWFRSKSKGKAPADIDDQDKPPMGPTPITVNTVAASSTSTVSHGQTPISEKSARSPFTGHPSRTASSHTDTSFTEKGFAGMFGRVAGTTSTPASKGAMAVHQGPLDQTTITTSPPPEVMKHVKKVLEDMGIEIQIEADYKYRCVRPKRRKAGAGAGLRDAGSGLAAFTMTGSAASNGVCWSLHTEDLNLTVSLGG